MINNRVLILGNSITRHAPAPELGWHCDWGMAASCEENDYVHILKRRILALDLSAQIKAITIVDWEQTFWVEEADRKKRDEARDFNAGIVIMRVAENVDDEFSASRDFSRYYGQLIRSVNPSGAARVVCTNCFWDRPNINQRIHAVAESEGYAFTDINHLHRDRSNMAFDRYSNEGVGWHPGDRGMLAIADLIWGAIETWI